MRRRHVAGIGLLAALLLGGIPRVNASHTVFDWQDWHVVGMVDWRMTGSGGGGVTRRVLTLMGSSCSGCGSDYSSLSPPWAYAGFQGAAGAVNARATVAVKIDDASSTGCSLVIVRLTLNRAQGPIAEGAPCHTFTNIGSFMRSRSFSTCSGSSTHKFTSAWWGTVGTNPLRVAHSEVGVDASMDNYFAANVRVDDDFSTKNAWSCYKTSYGQ